MSHFLVSYAGNKRNEYKYFKEYIHLDQDIKNIIEPFTGTSAISFNIWLEHKDKFNYYLNDNSIDIYNIYKLIKEKEPNEILEKLNAIKNNINSKDDFLNIYKSNYDVYEYIVLKKLSSFRFGVYEQRKRKTDYKFTKLQLDFFQFIKSPYVHISNDDWSLPFDKFKNDKDSLMLLDPPYLSVCNDFYQCKTLNVYEYLLYNKIETFQCQIYLILENMWINKLLFRNNKIICTYGKTYQTSKKITEHIIIYNK